MAALLAKCYSCGKKSDTKPLVIDGDVAHVEVHVPTARTTVVPDSLVHCDHLSVVLGRDLGMIARVSAGGSLGGCRLFPSLGEYFLVYLALMFRPIRSIVDETRCRVIVVCTRTHQ